MTEKNYILIKGSQGIRNRIISILNMILYSKLTNRTLTGEIFFILKKALIHFPNYLAVKTT